MPITTSLATTTGSSVELILPSSAELFVPAVAFAFLAALAGFVIWKVVRGVTRDSHDLAAQVARLEAENHELRTRLDERREEHV